jgi:hypothetical protein
MSCKKDGLLCKGESLICRLNPKVKHPVYIKDMSGEKLLLYNKGCSNYVKPS